MAYDPESVSQDLQIAESELESKVGATKPPPLPATRKQKSAGGFTVDDSDSDSEDGIPASSLNGLVAEPTPHGPPARSSLHNSTSAQDIPVADGLSNQSTRIQADGPTDSLPSAPAADSRPPFALASVVLPHDTTGLLELQIKDDPRGAMDAWLALMAEHRRRNKISDLRAVYIRFLELFPQAVCFPTDSPSAEY